MAGASTETEDSIVDPFRCERTVLFVYGTLKRGWGLAHMLEGQNFLGMARTVTRYRLHVLGDYPGLVEARESGGGACSIVGELWRVDAACLHRLDEVEGVDEGEYARRAIDLLPPWSEYGAQAYHYLGGVDGLPDSGECW